MGCLLRPFLQSSLPTVFNRSSSQSRPAGHPTEAGSLTQFHSALPRFIQWERLVRQIIRPSPQVLGLLAPIREQVSIITLNCELIPCLRYNLLHGCWPSWFERENRRKPNFCSRETNCDLPFVLLGGSAKTECMQTMSSMYLLIARPRNKLSGQGGGGGRKTRSSRSRLSKDLATVRVLSLDGAGVHTATTQATKDSTVMSFADFFMLEDADVLFRTHRSLFAATAAELFGKPGLSWHVIAPGNCKDDCPKYPEFCGDASDSTREL